MDTAALRGHLQGDISRAAGAGEVGKGRDQEETSDTQLHELVQELRQHGHVRGVTTPQQVILEG